MAVNFACYHNFVVAENDHAIAFSDLGHRYPTLAIYSKSRHSRPGEHTEEELRGFSEVVHACHCASGPQTSSNEEWYYAPRDTLAVMPWHILLKWRIFMHAGFEGGTRIYINPLSPAQLRDIVVAQLADVRDKGLIAPLRVGEECAAQPNCLLYNRP
jgi:galactose-1-phosphate uridylyltransferase